MIYRAVLEHPDGRVAEGTGRDVETAREKAMHTYCQRYCETLEADPHPRVETVVTECGGVVVLNAGTAAGQWLGKPVSLHLSTLGVDHLPKQDPMGDVEMIEAYTIGGEQSYDKALKHCADGKRVMKGGKQNLELAKQMQNCSGKDYPGGIVFLSVEAARAMAGEFIIQHGFPFAVYTLELESLDQTYVLDTDDQRYLLVNVPVGKKVEA